MIKTKVKIKTLGKTEEEVYIFIWKDIGKDSQKSSNQTGTRGLLKKKSLLIKKKDLSDDRPSVNLNLFKR